VPPPSVEEEGILAADWTESRNVLESEIPRLGKNRTGS
jgi:hypothetical protein